MPDNNLQQDVPLAPTSQEEPKKEEKSSFLDKLFKKKKINLEKIKEEDIPLPIEGAKEGLKFEVTRANPPPVPKFPDKTKINFRYPLIIPYAYAHIYWDEPNSELIYKVEEPDLTDEEKEIFNLLEKGIKELINISFISVKDEKVLIEYLEKNIRILLDELSITIEKKSYLKVMYYIYRDFIGLNKIEPLTADPNIEDIECNGVNSPIYIVHRSLKNMKTNIIYPELEELQNFVEKLAQKCGRHISYSDPLLDGTLPDKSRVNATFTQDISSKGPTFSIRKFTKIPFTPIKLMEMGTVSPEFLAYIWLLIENGMNILVVGGTGSGKTTLLNSAAFFIPPQARIISIEDTREIQLIHENWLPGVTREGIGQTDVEGKRTGEISLFDLLRESFRQRPDYVIVGEIRGKEAFVLFQGMASIRGNEKILVLNSKKPKRIAIKDMDNKIKYQAITIDPTDNKVKILPVRLQIKHSPRNKLIKVLTKSGREITTTTDHSLFTYNKSIIPIRADELKIKDKIVIPGRIPCGYADLNYINLIDYLPEIRIFSPEYIKNAVKKIGYYKASEICKIKSISDYYANFKRSQPSALKAESFLKLMKEANINLDLDKIRVRFIKKSKYYPAKLQLTSEFLKLLGYYLSEGSINQSGRNSTICLYNKNPVILEDMRSCIKKVVDNKIRERITARGFGSATELSFTHKVLFEFIRKYCGKGSLNKKIPDFIFGLSKEKIASFLTALYTGDGSVLKKQINYYSTSKELIDGLAQLLLVFGIVGRIKTRQFNNKPFYYIEFFTNAERREFIKYIKPIRNYEQIRELNKKNNKKIGDIYIDEIKDIKEIILSKEEPVYDISVPGAQNFIGGFGGILLHNSGHSCFSTMHANDVATVITRLETPPINLSASLVESLDAVIMIGHATIGGIDVRKVKTVEEVIKVGEGMKGTELNTPFRWDPKTNRMIFSKKSYVFEKIIQRTSLTPQELYLEFSKRANLLFRMYQKKVSNFEEVQKVIHEYYKNPTKVLKQFGLEK